MKLNEDTRRRKFVCLSLIEIVDGSCYSFLHMYEIVFVLYANYCCSVARNIDI